ncbi:hypothetical protein V501_10012 [Pseudogymnoascus sp. VKM F-4519 (FW-2642)]|nr:hypothetical protein V501_10012 [Pseudogymnoascus sp. VKM F-4519 (FW-2642)]
MTFWSSSTHLRIVILTSSRNPVAADRPATMGESSMRDQESLRVVKHGRTRVWTSGPLNEIWSDCSLRGWITEYCVLNKTTISETTFDLIGDAIRSLRGLLRDEDHATTLEYLRSIPVINDLDLAIITGRAGSSKTFFI